VIHFEIPSLFLPMGAPVCINLKTYPAKVEGGKIFADLG
jgi:nitrite reductase/ring-hydroxylating ferredoxin subunit